MNIKEVENLLQISRANVRYYEKEGLLNPERSENNYRNYSYKDIAQLKKIIVFRKLGFTVEEISGMQKGELDLNDIVDENIKRLQNEIEELKGALEITKKLDKEKTDFAAVDEEHYWNIINNEEKSGKRFIDVYDDYLKMELSMFDNMWKNIYFHDFKRSRKEHGVLVACGILLLICIIRGFASMLWWNGTFWEGFLGPFITFVIGSAIVLPLYILSKKAPKVGAILSTILLYVFLLFFLVLAIFVVVAIINNIFNLGLF